MNQTFNTTEIYYVDDPMNDMFRILRSHVILNSIMLPLGLALNAWMLLAIVTSKYLRCRMRNKIIISFCIQHLLECVAFLALSIDIKSRYANLHKVNCHSLNAYFHLLLMQDFITNWTLVILLAVYLAQVCDFRVESRLPVMPSFRGACAVLTPPWLVTFALLATPWAVSIIIFPTLILIPGTLVTVYRINHWCLLLPNYKYYIFKSLDTAVPLILAFCLLLTTVILKRRQSSRGTPVSEMRAGLVEERPEVDDWRPYAAAVFVIGVCQMGIAFTFIDLLEIYIIKSLTIEMASAMISECKVALIIFPWLLFSDIRERIKTWRPWRGEKDRPDVMLAFANVKSGNGV